MGVNPDLGSGSRLGEGPAELTTARRDVVQEVGGQRRVAAERWDDSIRCLRRQLCPFPTGKSED